MPESRTFAIIPARAFPPQPDEAGRRPCGRPFYPRNNQKRRSRRGRWSRQGWPEVQAIPALRLPWDQLRQYNHLDTFAVPPEPFNLLALELRQHNPTNEGKWPDNLSAEGQVGERKHIDESLVKFTSTVQDRRSIQSVFFDVCPPDGRLPAARSVRVWAAQSSTAIWNSSTRIECLKRAELLLYVSGAAFLNHPLKEST